MLHNYTRSCTAESLVIQLGPFQLECSTQFFILISVSFVRLQFCGTTHFLPDCFIIEQGPGRKPQNTAATGRQFQVTAYNLLKVRRNWIHGFSLHPIPPIAYFPLSLSLFLKYERFLAAKKKDEHYQLRPGWATREAPSSEGCF